MSDVFILNCSVFATVRQTIQFKMEDLNLPNQVVETLQQHQAVSIRPQLSNKLSQFLSQLRLDQNRLYSDHCISKAETHFLLAEHFEDAVALIEQMQTRAMHFNDDLSASWCEELANWERMVSNTIEPLFDDENQRALVKAAYLNVFPTQREYAEAIQILVVGPHPVDLDVAESEEDTLINRIAQTAAVNTSAVYEAAQAGAKDKALERCAILLDDLDTRNAQNISDRQTGGTSNRRGSWEVAAQELSLISSHVPGLNKIAQIAQSLIDHGRSMRDPLAPAADRSRSFESWTNSKKQLKDELKCLVRDSESSQGLQSLHKSLCLSDTYSELKENIQQAQSQEQLDQLAATVDTESAIYKQRIKTLEKLFTKRTEYIQALSLSAGDTLKEIQNEEPDACDF